MQELIGPDRSRHFRLCGFAALSFAVACAAPDTALSSGSSGSSRDTVLIDGEVPSCATCGISVIDSVRLGAADDAEIPQRDPRLILRDSHGMHYLVFNGWINKPILRYDSTGRYAGQLGRYGEGPGEYVMTGSALIGPGDSVHVLELSSRQGQVFTPAGEYGRQIAPGTRKIIAAATDGSGDLIAVSRAPPPVLSTADARSDLPPRVLDAVREAQVRVAPHVYRVAPDGTARDSFPIFSYMEGARHPTRGWMELQVDATPVVAPDGSVWTKLGSQYRLEQHAPDGAARKLIGVSIPGMRTPVMTRTDAESLLVKARSGGSGSVAVRDPTAADATALLSIGRSTVQIDNDGLLWMMRTVRAPRADTIKVTRDYLSPNEAPGEGTIPRNVTDRLHHTIVEVIDPSRGELIARVELPFAAIPVTPGYVGRVRTDEMERYLVHVYKLRLNR